jgi:transposase InsO family protein
MLQEHHRSPRQYDHRIRQAVVASGDPHLFPQLHIPKSTTRTWIRRGTRKVVSTEKATLDMVALLEENERLRARAEFYFAISSVLLILVRVFGVRIDLCRLPDAKAKASLLRAVKLGSRHVPRERLLKLLGLSRSRFLAWHRREVKCELDDRPSCPKSSPTRLTKEELGELKDHVLNPEYRHMSVRALSLHAQRLGKVFASTSTWRKLIKERGWLRPRARVYPARPKVGVRAQAPNEWWHVDLTVIRLLDGTKIYLHAVIDNFSRKILAWELSERICGGTTRTMLEKAGRFLDGEEVKLMSDAGVENINEVVDGFLKDSPVSRVLARVDVVESNSMIEAFWRSFRHQWLYLNEVDALATVQKLTEFYVEQHNTVMPHAAFDGATPDEMFFGRASVVDELAAHRVAARSARIEQNRKQSCGSCPKVGLVNEVGRVQLNAVAS